MNSRALLYCAGGGIGDSLVASVVARALHAHYDAVDAITLPAHAETLEHVPDVDSVLVDGGNDAHVAQMLASRSYDAVVVTWATSRIARIVYEARIPIRVGQSRRLYSWRFTQKVPVRSESGDVTTHWSQILLDFARVIGCDTLDARPRFVPASEDIAQAQSRMSELGVRAGTCAVIHPANAIATQRGFWPIDGWVRLAHALHEDLGLSVLVSGSKADDAIAQKIALESGARSIAGRVSIGGFAAMAQSAAVFAGITTGAMHVAAAAGARTVGVFPFQTDTPERWAPLGDHTAIVRATYPCRRGERKETCRDYACIQHLDVPRIVAAARSLLENP